MKIQIVLVCIVSSICSVSALTLFPRAMDEKQPLRISSAEQGVSPMSDSVNSALSPREEQNAEDYRLFISVSKPLLAVNQDATVTVKIENKMEHIIDPKALGYVLFKLSKYGKQAAAPRVSELFISDFRLNNLSTKKDEPLIFQANLASLTWQDSLSSEMNLNEIDNLFSTVPAGDYYLFVEVQLPTPYSADGIPRFVSVKSNEILVKLK